MSALWAIKRNNNKSNRCVSALTELQTLPWRVSSYFQSIDHPEPTEGLHLAKPAISHNLQTENSSHFVLQQMLSHSLGEQLLQPAWRIACCCRRKQGVHLG